MGGVYKREYFDIFPLDQIPIMFRSENPQSDTAVMYLLWRHSMLAKAILVSAISFIKNTDIFEHTNVKLLVEDTLDISMYEDRFHELKIDIVRMQKPVNRCFAVQHTCFDSYRQIITIDSDFFALNPCKVYDTIDHVRDPLTMVRGRGSIELLMLSRKSMSTFRQSTDEEYFKALSEFVGVNIDDFMQTIRTSTNRAAGMFMNLKRDLFANPEWKQFSRKLFKLTRCPSDEFNFTLFYLFVKRTTIPYWEDTGFPSIAMTANCVRQDSTFIHPFMGLPEERELVFSVSDAAIKKILS